MKRLTVSLLSFLIFDAHAQMPPGMNQAQMQKMMQQMQNMQTCMQKIDKTEMKAFEQRAGTMESEVKALCAQGQRDKAQSVAMAFGMDIAQSPSLQEMKKCSEHMKGFVPKIPAANSVDSDNEPSPKHVCDEID